MEINLLKYIIEDDIEAGVIGGLIDKPELVDEYSGILEPEMFINSEYRRIYETMLQIRNENKDLDYFTLSSRTGLKMSFFVDLSFKYTTITEVEKLIKRILERAKLLSLLRYLEKLPETLQSGRIKGFEELTQELEENISELLLTSVETKKEYYNTLEIADELMENVKEKKPIPVLYSGWNDFDTLIGGFEPGNLILIGARTSVGKTAFMLNLIKNFALLDKKCLLFSIEMDKISILQRLLALSSGISISEIRKSVKYETDDSYSFLGAIVEKYKEQVKDNIYITDQSYITPNKIRSYLRKFIKKHPLDAVFIDYIQLMRDNHKTENKVEEISNIARDLKLIAREFNVPIFALAQVNRNVEARQDKRPSLADLRDSGALEQESDIVMLLYREDYYGKPEDKQKSIVKMEVDIAKHRNGPTGVVTFMFDKPSNIITSYANKILDIKAEGV